MYSKQKGVRQKRKILWENRRENSIIIVVFVKCFLYEKKIRKIRRKNRGEKKNQIAKKYRGCFSLLLYVSVFPWCLSEKKMKK